MAFRLGLNQPRWSLAPAPLACAVALLTVSPASLAQQAPQVVTVTGRASAAHSAGVAGFGDVPLARLPLSATVISASQLADAGIASLGDITRLDAGVTDAYNAPGYWGQLAVRGFTLDNRFNYRRDGLPINAETMLPTANKAALELLKGISGIQAGTSSPGGLLNLVVKRPTARALRSASVDWTQPASANAAVDLSDRAGSDGAIGWRLNASASHHEPQTRNSRGHARLLAGALEWKHPAGLLELEFEDSLQSQPSTPGFSLLGAQVPDASAIDPRLNLNNQAWSLPVVLTGRTGSLRYTHHLDETTRVVAHLQQQRLQSDDRIAFPSGCSAENNFDRYCSDGSFDLYDFRSDGERRTSTAADLSLAKQLDLAGLRHELNLGLTASRFRARFNEWAFNFVGVGSIRSFTAFDPAPGLSPGNANRSERSTELHLQDRVALSPDGALWAGLRHTRLARESALPDGSEATAYRQALSTPWLALSWQFMPGAMAYGSWGRGMESDVVPNRDTYANRGQALPALKSRQWELGWKHQAKNWSHQLAWFNITRPQWNDFDAATGAPPAAGCTSTAPCLRRADGSAHHAGVEGSAEWQTGPWSLRASALAQRTRREASADPAINGKRPPNVPEYSLKAQAVYNVSAVPGLALLAFATHEGRRTALPKEEASTPGWTRWDLGLRYATHTGDMKLVWRLGVDNLANTRAWKEAPYQFSHAYLYPLQPRTWRASVQATF